MPHIALVAPHFLENTNRYVKAFSDLEGVKLSVISEDPEKKLPQELRARVAGHYQVDSVGDSAALARALKGLARGLGPVDRLTGALEQLQLPWPRRGSWPTCPACARRSPGASATKT